MKIIEIEKKKNVIPFTDKEKVSGLIEISKRIQSKQIKLFNPPKTENFVYHEGYLGYLSKAWGNHYSIVLRPDDVWFIILNEISTTIAKNPSWYATLFTKTPETKQLILTLTGDVESINPAAVVDALKDRVPSKIDDFIPKFSTSTPNSIMAMNVAFCDLVSSYYSYGTYLCGIPSIRVEGDKYDWELAQLKLQLLSELFNKDPLQLYLQRCLSVVNNISDAIDGKKSVDFFKSMVKVKPCGSGHQFKMDGWILKLLNIKHFDSPVQLDGLPPLMSNMKYFNLETKRTFILYCGLFYSNIVDGFMIPEYESARIETTNGINIAATPQKNKEKSLTEMTIASTPIVPTKKVKGNWKYEIGDDIKSFHSL